MTPHPQPKGELEYGSILPNGEDWRLRKFDAGMGETEYWIFKNKKFFAQFDNREDADIVMVVMTCKQSERDNVLWDRLVDMIDAHADGWNELCEMQELVTKLRQQGEQAGGRE